MKKRVAINGFGRIGRAAARIILADHKDLIELVAVNDPSPTEQIALLFQFDSNFGRLGKEVSVVVESDKEFLQVGNDRIRSFGSRNISDLPWGELGIDIVLECTGVFRTVEGVQPHLDQGAKKVILSAPAKGDGFTSFVLGVNDEMITGKETMISNASCTTNCLAPVAKVLNDSFGIECGLMTTIHSYTNDQRILDVGHSDLRRARAAAINMIPTSTGAAKAVALVIPEMKGKLTGTSIRVPTPSVSLVDLTVKVKKSVTKEEVNAALKAASEKMPHILGYETLPLVSSDYRMDPRSSIVDADETFVMQDLVKVLAWYDNEWGYSSRLVELVEKL